MQRVPVILTCRRDRPRRITTFAEAGSCLRAFAMLPARRLVGRRHDVHAGASPGMPANSAISSRQMRWPSATGSAAASSRATNASGMIVPQRCSFIQRADFAERSGAIADDQGEATACPRARRAVRRSAARCRHPCRTGSARIARRPRPWRRASTGCQSGRRIDRRVGGADEEVAACPAILRPVGSSPCSRIRRAMADSAVVSMSNTGLVSGWSPALGSSPVSTSRLRTPVAAAPIRSPCSAMRLRSRQVNCRIGSMPLATSSAAAIGAPDGRGHWRRR